MTRSGQRALGAVVALVLLSAGWRVVSLGMADHFALSDAGRALWWRGDHPEALVRRAEGLARGGAVGPEGRPTVGEGEAGAAEAMARRGIRANPLDGRGYRVLGQVARDPDEAVALLGIAAARSPRDVASHVWLIDHYMKRGDLPAAIGHMDTLLRVQPGVMPTLLPVMVALAGDPAAQPALAERLLAAPPWGPGYLAHLIANVPDINAFGPLMERLRTTPGGLRPDVLAAWVDRLTREGRWGQAYLTWVSQLPPERLQGLGNVFNGGFEWEPAQGGFDWRLGKVAGARITRTAGSGVDGERALRVAFEDRRVPFSHVRQMLALPPGRYRLTGRARPENLRTDRGLAWTVACANPEATLLGETEPLRGHGDWRELSLDFEVPAEGCGGQWLALIVRARIPAEQRIGGVAWFDSMRIARNPR
jgi:hypothetical protein